MAEASYGEDEEDEEASYSPLKPRQAVDQRQFFNQPNPDQSYLQKQIQTSQLGPN